MADDVIAQNEVIADSFSTLLYDPIVPEFLDVERLFGQAALFGKLGRPVDVLDLACGTGAMLLHAANQVEGRLVGIDISPRPIEFARERLAPLGERVELHCADLLETSAESLGQFDLIYNIGVIYATPLPVQRRILELIGKCLRPGGIASLSYHAGAMPALRPGLHRLLLAGHEHLPLTEAIAAARARAAELGNRLAGRPGTELQRAALEAIMFQSDIVFYHEVFNASFGPMQTTAVARELDSHGIDFAWYVAPAEADLAPNGLDRAIAADIADLERGEYRYAIYARYLEAGPCNPVSPHLRWNSYLSRDNPGDFSGPQAFAMRAQNLGATIPGAASVAMLDCLAEAPDDWAGIQRRTVAALGGKKRQLSAAELAAMAADLTYLWRHGFLYPTYITPNS